MKRNCALHKSWQDNTDWLGQSQLLRLDFATVQIPLDSATSLRLVLISGAPGDASE